jgi:hypothetical protein
MSDQSDLQDEVNQRKYLLLGLLQMCGLRSIEADILVQEATIEKLSDGGMGSFFLVGRKFDRNPIEVISARFIDYDGIDVYISVLCGSDMLPVEVEMWKVDFGQTKKIPSCNELYDVNYNTY